MCSAKDRHSISIRRGCEIAKLHRSTFHYQPNRRDDSPLRKRLRELAGKRPKWGLPMLTVLLRREGVMDNHKRIERVYREEGLQVRRRKRKRVARVASRRIVEVPKAPNERWSIDFVHDSLMTGRQFKVLTTVDDFSKESPAIVVGQSITGHHVVDVLERLAESRSLPREIVMDNGPEFTSLALDQWAHRRGVHLRFIRPGRPVENCFIESFNGKFRNECLDENWFLDMNDARRKIEAWRVDYNTTRPHSSLDDLTPEEFLKTLEECQLSAGP